MIFSDLWIHENPSANGIRAVLAASIAVGFRVRILPPGLVYSLA